MRASLLSVLFCLSVGACVSAHDVELSIERNPSSLSEMASEAVSVSVLMKHSEFENGLSCTAKPTSWLFPLSSMESDFIGLFADNCEYDIDRDVWSCLHTDLLSSYTGTEWIKKCEDGSEDIIAVKFSSAAISSWSSMVEEEQHGQEYVVEKRIRAYYCFNDRVNSYSDYFRSSGSYTCMFPSNDELVVSSRGNVAARRICGTIKGKGMRAQCKMNDCALKEWWGGRKNARGPSRVTCEEPQDMPTRGLMVECPVGDEAVAPAPVVEATKKALTSNGQEVIRQVLRDVPGNMLGPYDATMNLLKNWRDPNKSNSARDAVVMATALMFLAAKNNPVTSTVAPTLELVVSNFMSEACLTCLTSQAALKECIDDFLARRYRDDNVQSAGLRCSSDFFVILLSDINLGIMDNGGNSFSTRRPMAIFGVESWKTFQKGMLSKMIYSAIVVGAFSYSFYYPDDDISPSTVAYAKIAADTLFAISGAFLRKTDALNRVQQSLQPLFQRGKQLLCRFSGGCHTGSGEDEDARAIDMLLQLSSLSDMAEGDDISPERSIFAHLDADNKMASAVEGLAKALQCNSISLGDVPPAVGGPVHAETGNQKVIGDHDDEVSKST